jgi:manganese oxidase
MMTGEGPFGSVEMGGMFSVVKVRAGLARGDYRDPGWYNNPPGTVAHKVDGGAASAPQTATAAPQANPARGGKHPAVIEVRARRRTLGMQGMPTSDPPPAATPTTSSMPGTPMQHDMSTMGRPR